MQAVEHRQGCQGNPDASRYLHRPEPASSPEDQYGDGGCASAVNAPRGPCARHGCVGSDSPPRAVRRRAPGSNRCVCSSADRGRSGCTTGPGRSTERTGTSGRNRRCAPRGSPSPRCWTDASQRATLWWHRLTRHGVGRGTVDQPPSDGPLPRPTTSASSRVVQRAALRASQAPARNGPVPNGVDDPSGPIHHDMLRPPPGGSTACLRLHGRPSGGHAGEELTGAAVTSHNHRVRHPGMQIRVLASE